MQNPVVDMPNGVASQDLKPFWAHHLEIGVSNLGPKWGPKFGAKFDTMGSQLDHETNCPWAHGTMRPGTETIVDQGPRPGTGTKDQGPVPD